MIVGGVAGEARRHLIERKLRQHGDAVKGLLTVHRNIVSECLECLARKGVIDTLGLLQADDIRLPFDQPGGQIIHSLLDRVYVPSGDAHGRKTRVCGREFNWT